MTIGGTSPPDARRFCDPQRHTHRPPGREWLGPHAFSRGCCHWPSGQGHVLNKTLRTTACLHGRPPPGRATARMPLRQPDASPSRGDILSRYWTSYRSPPLGTVRDAPSAYPTTGTAALPRLSSVCCAGTRDPSSVAAMRLPAARVTFQVQPLLSGTSSCERTPAWSLPLLLVRPACGRLVGRKGKQLFLWNH